MNLRSRYEEDEVEFQMAPMIDVVFLLLIFFMCASSFHVVDREEDVVLPIAEQSKTRKEMHGELIVNVKSDGTILVSDKPFGLGELQAGLREAVDMVKGTSVVIRGDRATKHGIILEVMRACAEADISDVSFAALQQEKTGAPR